MAEYIEREALRLKVQRYLMPNVDADGTVLVNDAERYFLKLLEDAPAADVVEVRRGKWFKDTKTADVCAEYRCSLCGFMYCEADPKYPPYKYCPECGSKNE